MRSADAVTLIRVGIIVVVAYLVLTKFNPIIIAILIAIAMLLDAVDGYFAIREASAGKIGFGKYISAALGDKKAKQSVSNYKKKLASISKYGARIDVAGDRAVEYILWMVYVYTGVLPFLVIVIVVIRHSFVDAVMAARGTSSKMKTKFAQLVYSSNLGRGGINVVKFLTFAYLAFVYIWLYPDWIGHALAAILLIYIILRGIAEIYEAYA